MTATTFTETFTSSKSTTGQENTVFTVNPGKEFEVAEIKIGIESGAGSNVGVRVFDGDKPIAPQDNQLDISGELIPLPTDATLSPGDELVARHDNNSSTDRDVTVIVVGESNA